MKPPVYFTPIDKVAAIVANQKGCVEGSEVYHRARRSLNKLYQKRSRASGFERERLSEMICVIENQVGTLHSLNRQRFLNRTMKGTVNDSVVDRISKLDRSKKKVDNILKARRKEKRLVDDYKQRGSFMGDTGLLKK